VSSELFEAVIGIEVHVQLKTRSKIFSSDPTTFDSSDNENTSEVSLGMPGSLPVLNKNAVIMAAKAGLALNCSIRNNSVFARKNYFYPDLPKGYQISQYDLPICEKGYVEFKVNGVHKKIAITRAHLEEDAGKSTHSGSYSLINYNRAGVPLIEIVSEPEMHSAEEAAEYCRTIRGIVTYLDVCDGNLEEGSLRCDCNVSVKRKDTKEFGTRVEIKNLNSFRFIEKAVNYEIDRQIDVVSSGGKIIQETRLYDADKNKTYTMRVKEDADDYRYFPDPDLLPITIDGQQIEQFKNEIPELPFFKKERFISAHGLNESDANLLTSERSLADFFEKTGQISGNYKSAANWIMIELLRELKDRKTSLENSPITEARLADLIKLVDDGKISGKIAKTIFIQMFTDTSSATDIMNKKGLKQVTDLSAIEGIVLQVLNDNPSQVAEFKSGKEKILGYLVGQIMRLSKGQASPEVVNSILIEKLKS
jgi:aspartyl-tRNA(Asn)/glutamyl-tRNA(Gln) amidotransferase subunit B